MIERRNTAMTPRLDFTDGEKTKMGEYLIKKADFEDKRRILLRELEQVESKIIEMQREYGAIYNKRNPILGLPVEVTCLIFTFAQVAAQLPSVHESKDDESEEDDDKGEDEDDFLLEVVVSHVCHEWRSISLGFPKLWTSFFYEAGSSFVVPLQRFDTYLKRSAALPLRICLDFQSGSDDPDYVQLVEKAVEQVHRWQHFSMYSNDETAMQPFHLLNDISAPMLEYLTLVPGVDLDEIADDDSLHVVTNMDPCIFKGGAPKLTYVMLDGYSLPNALPPLSNITILRIERQDCDVVPMFESAPFLELLSLPSLSQLSLRGDLIAPFGIPRNVHMPNLKRFRVGDFETIWDLLPNIRAPQLDTLIIHMCQSASEFLTGTIHSSPDMSYAFPSLRKLYVLDSNVESSVASTFTHVTSQATDVLISHGDLQTSLIQTIVNEHYTDTVWPRLKILSCNIPEVETIDTYVAFASCRPKGSFAFRLHPALFDLWDEGLDALEAVSSVIMDAEWELDEPFWPQDTDHDPGKDDTFSISEYF